MNTAFAEPKLAITPALASEFAKNEQILIELIACSVDELIPVSEIIENEISTNQGDISDMRVQGYQQIGQWLASIAARSVTPYSQVPNKDHLGPTQRKLHTLTSVVFPEFPKMYLVEYKDVQGLITQVLANNNTTPDELQITEEIVSMEVLDKTFTGFTDLNVVESYPSNIPL